MKRLVMGLMIIGVCSLGYAAETGKSSLPVPGTSLHSTSIREHVHEYTDTDTQNTQNRKDFQAGVGLDVKVYKFKKGFLEDINVETKWDAINKDASVYVVLGIDLTGGE